VTTGFPIGFNHPTLGVSELCQRVADLTSAAQFRADLREPERHVHVAVQGGGTRIATRAAVDRERPER
jgi:hypothetical protein